MDGLLLKLLDDRLRGPGPSFWKLFEPIRQDLDRLFWYFPWPPWLGGPDTFREDDSATASFEGEERTTCMLWQPGSLGRYADDFAEEWVQLWGIEPTTDDPRQLAAEYAKYEDNDLIRRRGRVWLLYTEWTCWEIYARKPRLLDEVRTHLQGKPWVEVYESHIDRRAAAFAAAGESRMWPSIGPR